MQESKVISGTQTNGTLRGWPIAFDENKQEWVFADNLESTKETYKDRPCKKCGIHYDDSSCDPCLGTLPGVKNACCGHGVQQESYIQFSNGITVRGFEVDISIKETKR